MVSIGDFPVTIKRHVRAKRINLRYDPASGNAVITLPRYATEKEAMVFVGKNLQWLKEQRLYSPERKYLSPGQTIPLFGKEFGIIHRPDSTGRIALTDRDIIVGGHRNGFSVRLENHLKRRTRKLIEPLATEMAKKINKSFKRIQIRDTKSRWGSCSSSGNLSFSWRLIMTPPDVLEYVVAHEVSHLQEMNHSAAFWSVVDCLVPDANQSRKWLRSEGKKLMLICHE